MMNGKLIAATIDPKETNLVMANTKIKIDIANKAPSVCIASMIPSNVAIPFPPLNPAKTGKMCPMTAAIPKPIDN